MLLDTKVPKIIRAGREGVLEDLAHAKIVRITYRNGGTLDQIVDNPDRNWQHYINGPSLGNPNGVRSTAVLENLEQIEIIAETETLAANLLLDLATKCREQEDRLRRIDKRIEELKGF